MNGELEPYEPPSAELAVHTGADFAVSEATRQLILDGIPANTARAYQRQWADFGTWCQQSSRLALPATSETLAEYVQHLATRGLSPASISQALSAVRTAHRQKGFKEQPDLEGPLAVLKGHRKNWANAGGRTKKAAPVLVGPLRDMTDTCSRDTLTGIRDRAVLTLGWFMMARRSELAALMWADVIENPNGMTVYIAKSKTDKLAKGVEVAIPRNIDPKIDAVAAVRDWRRALTAAGITGAYLFRSIDRHGNVRDKLGASAVGRIVMKAVNAAGLPNADMYSAHGLRAGAATQAYVERKPLSAITQQGRWADNSPVVLGYIRAVDKWADNAMNGIGE